MKLFIFSLVLVFSFQSYASGLSEQEYKASNNKEQNPSEVYPKYTMFMNTVHLKNNGNNKYLTNRATIQGGIILDNNIMLTDGYDELDSKIDDPIVKKLLEGPMESKSNGSGQALIHTSNGLFIIAHDEKEKLINLQEELDLSFMNSDQKIDSFNIGDSGNIVVTTTDRENLRSEIWLKNKKSSWTKVYSNDSIIPFNLDIDGDDIVFKMEYRSCDNSFATTEVGHLKILNNEISDVVALIPISPENRNERIVQILDIKSSKIIVYLKQDERHIVRSFDTETFESTDQILPSKFNNVFVLNLKLVDKNTFHVIDKSTGTREIISLSN